MGPVAHLPTLTELLVLSEAQPERPLALTELQEAALVIMEEVVPRRVHMELQGALGMESEGVKMVSVMEVVLRLPARMGHLVEAKVALDAMEEVALDLVVTEAGLLPAHMELQVDPKTDLGATVAAKHLPVLTELLAAVRMVSEVGLTEVVLHRALTELQVDLKMDSGVTEAAEHLLVLMALLAVVRTVSADLLQVHTELQVAVRVVSVDLLRTLMELLAVVRTVLAGLLQTLTELLVAGREVLVELLVAVRAVSADLLQVLTELLEAGREVLEELLVAAREVSVDLLQALTEPLAVVRAVSVELLQALTEPLAVVRTVSVDLLQALTELLAVVRAVSADLLQVLTELLAVVREGLDRLAVEHLPVPMERLVVVKTVSMVQVRHLLALTVHQMVEAVGSGSEAELSLRLDPVRAVDMEVARAMMDLQ
jgi:hypothetical protein